MDVLVSTPAGEVQISVIVRELIIGSETADPVVEPLICSMVLRLAPS
jgi:hypothetical protein